MGFFFIYKGHMSIDHLKLIPVLIKDDLQSQPSIVIYNCKNCTVTGLFSCVTSELASFKTQEEECMFFTKNIYVNRLFKIYISVNQR